MTGAFRCVELTFGAVQTVHSPFSSIKFFLPVPLAYVVQTVAADFKTMSIAHQRANSLENLSAETLSLVVQSIPFVWQSPPLRKSPQELQSVYVIGPLARRLLSEVNSLSWISSANLFALSSADGCDRCSRPTDSFHSSTISERTTIQFSLVRKLPLISSRLRNASVLQAELPMETVSPKGKSYTASKSS
jgi:hypothetical protein